MQRLLTITLTSSGQRHGTVEEHLAHFLTAGWRVASLRTVNGPQGGWAIVVLEADPATQPAAAALMPKMESPSSDAGRPVPPSNVPVTAETKLRVGGTVLSFSQGRWWRAEIVALEEGGLVRIHFPGWDSKWDVSIPREELQEDVPPR